MPADTLDELLTEQLKDLYDAEKQLTQALPKMAKAASDAELKQGFQQHLEQTKGHVTRLEKAFQLLDTKAKGKPCAAMKGLIAEGQETIGEDAPPEIKDEMLIVAAQKVEHYEISGYGSARTLAEALGQGEVANLLSQTEEEEKETDQKLTTIAERILEEANEGMAEGEDEETDLEDEDMSPPAMGGAAPAKKKATKSKKR